MAGAGGGRRLFLTRKDGISYRFGPGGHLLQISDRNGQTLTYGYDAGRLSSITDPVGRVLELVFDASGHLVEVIDAAGRRVGYSYNAAGQLLAVTDPTGVATTFTYDARGRKTGSTDALGHTTSFAYDAVGNQTAITDARHHTLLAAYDAGNRLTTVTAPLGRQTAFGYDGLGRRTSLQDALGRVTSYEYDGLGQLRAVQDALHQRTTYGYDAVGNRAQVTDARGNTGREEYDALHRRICSTPVADFPAEAWHYYYDGNGNLVQRVDPSGQATLYTYDSRNRLATVPYPSGAGVQFTYDANGNRLTMRDAQGLTHYTYDALNRLTAVTDALGHTVSYAYDGAGRRTRMTTSWGSTVYQYDAAGRLGQVIAPAGGVIQYTYDATGNCTQATHSNNDTITYTYDPLNRLTQVLSRQGTTTIASFGYGYDEVGNRVSMTTSAGTHSYQYDALYRLTRATRPNGHYTQYGYDPVGNRTSKAEVSGGTPRTTTYAYDQRNRLLTATDPEGVVTSYGYDGNGNQLSVTNPSGVTSYVYDEENRLGAISYPTGVRVEYTYDGDGRRVRMKDPNVEVFYQYDGTQVIADRDGAGALIASYLSGLGALLVSTTQKDGTFYYHHDGLGSIVALTDQAGTEVASYDYDEFGILKLSQSQPWNHFKFTSAIHDVTPGLYLMGARYYDPSLGRFITQDSWRGDPWVPWTQHLYAYVGNNPVNYTDPTGHIPFCVVTGIAGAVIGGTIAYLRNRGEEDVWARVAEGALWGGLLGFGSGIGAAKVLTGTAWASTSRVAGAFRTFYGIGATSLAEHLRKSTHNPNSVVLGHRWTDPPYWRIGENLGKTYFKVVDETWKALESVIGSQNMWVQLNRKFILQQHTAGKQFILSYNPDLAAAGSFYAREIHLLTDLGYQFVPYGPYWTAIPK